MTTATASYPNALVRQPVFDQPKLFYFIGAVIVAFLFISAPAQAWAPQSAWVGLTLLVGLALYWCARSWSVERTRKRLWDNLPQYITTMDDLVKKLCDVTTLVREANWVKLDFGNPNTEMLARQLVLLTRADGVQNRLAKKIGQHALSRPWVGWRGTAANREFVRSFTQRDDVRALCNSLLEIQNHADYPRP